MMAITETRLRLEIKRALIGITDKMSIYNNKARMGKVDKKLLLESALLNAYVESLRYMLLETSALDVDIIAWQSGTTVRYTFNSIPNISSNYNVLFDIGEGDVLSVTTATTDSNNGEYDITAVGGTSSLLSALDVNTIAWQNDFTVRYALNGSPNLSGLVAGDRLICTLATNSSNNGNFRITTINDASDYIDVTNLTRIDDEDDEASDSPAVCDATRPIDFIEIDNAARTDATDDEASDSPAVAIIKFTTRNFTDIEINNILEHMNILLEHTRKAYITTS